MLIVGVTGGIASGKSLVMRSLAHHGAIVFSADEAARAVLAPQGDVLRQITAAFGSRLLLPNGSLDRAKLGSLVFQSPEARHTLNQITHPPILRLLHAQIESVYYELSPHHIVAVEIPLLYETHLENWFDSVVVVSVSPETQARRLCQRNQMSESQAQQRISSQMPLKEKAQRADIVIENDGSAEDTLRQTQALWKQLLSQRHRTFLQKFG